MNPEVATRSGLLDEVLDASRGRLGRALPAYRGHAYRMWNFARALAPGRERDDDLAVCAAFHDLALFPDGNLDYLEPSVELAREYLAATGRSERTAEIAEMIRWHHKITPLRGENTQYAEIARRADLVDVSLGMVRFGLPRAFVAEVQAAFPNEGFHLAVAKTIASWAVRHPRNPLPVFRW